MDRVTGYNYVPTDGARCPSHLISDKVTFLVDALWADDVLKARLKTIGVSEYKFEMEAGDQRGTQWRIVDVGGSRFQVSMLAYSGLLREQRC